jgi:3-deoxy-D-manno-octulosonate 8-phosphate phosphatase (KDO 8-P phosphatase)
VDGVLTDGRLIYGPAGETVKRFHVHDGLGLVLARRAGLEVAVISARRSRAVAIRMGELRITEVHQGVRDKARAFASLLRRLSIDPDEAAVMGDDLTDIPLMERAGLALAPANAVYEVKKAANWVARRAGGQGAVREAVQMLLSARGAWPPARK